MPRPRQLSLIPRRRVRKLGRPRLHDAGIAHRTRPAVVPRLPLHVTVRMEPRVWNLRSRRSFRVIDRALFASMQRDVARVCHFSIQGNHIHLIVEAADKRALSSTMRSLNIRLGLGLNKLMSSRGRVVAHRYHARALRTPTEVRNARNYVLQNHAHHASDSWVSVVDPYSSAAFANVPAPKTWLLSVGWKRGGPG